MSFPLRPPTEVVAETYERLAASQPAAWITVVPRDEALARAHALESEGRGDRPLWGVPFAVKDNMDVAGMPTTAACPAFAYTADCTAPAVQRLLDAGAILVGKTNLDQFATGLVGTRSPYGICHSELEPSLISGGSSAGSAVAVAAGVVPFSLGTDTAGSGRVPAAANGIVGLKPTRGLVSIEGVVPACRSIDCVSVFARTVADAATVLDVLALPSRGKAVDRLDTAMRGFDRAGGGEASPTARNASGRRIGVPPRATWQLSPAQTAAFEEVVSALSTGAGSTSGTESGIGEFAREGTRAGAGIEIGTGQSLSGRTARAAIEVREFDPEPLLAAGALLYEGAFVAERLTTVGPLLAANPYAIEPIVRKVVERGVGLTAVELFADLHRLSDLQDRMARVWDELDALVCPTVPDIPTLAEVEADPIGVNTALGRWTNGVNLLDLCAVTIPQGTRPDGLPGSVTVIAPAAHDHQIAALASALLRNSRDAAGGRFVS